MSDVEESTIETFRLVGINGPWAFQCARENGCRRIGVGYQTKLGAQRSGDRSHACDNPSFNEHNAASTSGVVDNLSDLRSLVPNNERSYVVDLREP